KYPPIAPRISHLEEICLLWLRDHARSDGEYQCALCESVEPDSWQFLRHFHCHKGVGSYLVSHQSPKGFASYIGFGHNMHRQLYIPLPRWTGPRNFASYSTKKLENAQASGNPGGTLAIHTASGKIRIRVSQE